MTTVVLSAESLVLGSIIDLTACKLKVNTRMSEDPDEWYKSRGFNHKYEVDVLDRTTDCVSSETYTFCRLENAELVILEHKLCPMGFKKSVAPTIAPIQFTSLP